jgi:hypothetical protein
MEFKIEIGGVTLTETVTSLDELIERSSYYRQFPTHCPVDGTIAYFHFNRDSKGRSYHSLISTGIEPYEFKLGKRTDGPLFPKFYPHDVWVKYDADRKANVVVWLNGVKGEDLSPKYPVIIKDRNTNKVLFNGREYQAPARPRFMTDDDEQGEVSTTPTPSAKKDEVPTEFLSQDRSKRAIAWAVSSKFYLDAESAKKSLKDVYLSVEEAYRDNDAAVWKVWTEHCVTRGVQRG